MRLGSPDGFADGLLVGALDGADKEIHEGTREDL